MRVLREELHHQVGESDGGVDVDIRGFLSVSQPVEGDSLVGVNINCSTAHRSGQHFEIGIHNSGASLGDVFSTEGKGGDNV